MSSLKGKLFLSVFGAAMTASVAFAADLPAPPIIEYEPETPVEIGAGWYLRGDLGLTKFNVGEVSWLDPANGLRKFHDSKFDVTFLGGIGAGVKFNNGFRLDVTGDYRKVSKYKGKVACIPATCSSSESAELGAFTVMGNIYYDVDTGHGFTIYGGAGAGVAHLTVGNYGTSAGPRFADGNTTNFAWNLMAGVSAPIDDKVEIDASYRYMNLGDAKTSARYTNGNSATNPVRFKDVTAHDFRVGLRYNLN